MYDRQMQLRRCDGSDMLTVDYDQSVFPFREWFASVLGTNDLENLHILRGVNVDSYASHVEVARTLCERSIEELQRLVHTFMSSEVEARFGPVAGFQPTPTLRFHFAVMAPELREESADVLSMPPDSFLAKYYFDGARVGMFHRDRDYGLVPGSINIWVPVTNVSHSNGLWVGGPKAGGRDAEPVAMRVGQALFFDGTNRWHGAIWNTSGSTRVSFDVRFFPAVRDNQVVVQ